MAEFEQIIRGKLKGLRHMTITSNKGYNISDYPIGGITNEEMAIEFDDGYIYPIGATFVCRDNGKYKKDRVYRFTGVGWEDLGTFFDVSFLASFIKSVLVNGNTLTLTRQDNTTITFTPANDHEPAAFIKSVSVSGNTLTLTKQDNTTITFTPANDHEPASFIKSVSVNGNTLTLTKQDNTTTTFTPSTPSTDNEPIVTQNVQISSSSWYQAFDSIIGYTYAADITVQGATDNDVSVVSFDAEDADSGDFASICDTTENTVTIYSKTERDVTIPVILTIKTDTEREDPPSPPEHTLTKTGTNCTISVLDLHENIVTSLVHGHTYRVLVSANTGYYIGGITLNGASIQNNSTFTALQNTTINVESIPQTFTLMTSVAECTICVRNSNNECVESVVYNETYTISVVPFDGYRIDEITLNGQVVQNNSTFVATGNTTLFVEVSALRETWVINETPDLPHIESFDDVNFTSDGTSYDYILLHGRYGEISYGDQFNVVYDEAGRGWYNQAYRTITFEPAPTGALRTWLQANATLQT